MEIFHPFLISCDYPFIYGADTGWAGPDPHEGGAGHQDDEDHMWLSLSLLMQEWAGPDPHEGGAGHQYV